MRSLVIKIILSMGVLFLCVVSYGPIRASTGTAGVNVDIISCTAPAVGTSLTLTVASGDRLSVTLANPVGSSTITPNTSTMFSLTRVGALTVCRYTVSNGGGSSMALAAPFTGMTFSNPSLTIRNTNVDTTGTGLAGTPANTTMMTLGALAANAIALTSGTSIQIKNGATGTTNFAFGSSSPITLTAYPTNESSLAATGNAIFTLTLTITQIAG